MPWDVRKRGSKYVVVKEGSGKVVGTHDTRSKAERQLSALYANYDKDQDRGRDRGRRKR